MSAPVTDAEIAEWRRFYSARPWIGEAMRLAKSITLSQADSRRVYELAGAVERKDKKASAALGGLLLSSGAISVPRLKQLLRGEIR